MDFNKNETNENLIEEVSEIKIEDGVEKVEMPIVKPFKKSKKNTADCPVVSVISNSKYIITFNDFGLVVDDDNAQRMNGKTVRIEYTGTIGKSDFTFEVIKKNV